MNLQLFLITLSIISTICNANPHRQIRDTNNYMQLTQHQIKHLQDERGFGPTRPSPFRVAYAASDRDVSVSDEEEDEDIRPASTQARSPYHDDTYLHNIIPIQVRPQVQPQLRIQQQQQAYKKNYNPAQNYNAKQLPKDKSKLEEEEEIEEPDRLTMLLPQSKFDCSGKKTGYYADQELNCEIFHYCQDNARHSWICPEGFTFHQVHLICMPPSGDNICSKSSRFHFVNDYLYKPINLQEHQSKPNVSLKYSDRYYPEHYYDQNNNYDDDDEIDDDDQPQPHQQPQHHHQQQQQPQHYQHHRKPIGLQHAVPQFTIARGGSTTTSSSIKSLRADNSVGQVFHSPEEVNISLQQRRPLHIAQRYRDELGY